MDRTWVLLTEAAAIISLISLAVVLGGLLYLALKTRAFVRQVRSSIKGMAQESKDTSEAVREGVKELGERASRLREVLAGSSGRIREGWRASVTRTTERRES